MSKKHFFSYVISFIFVVISLIIVAGSSSRILEQANLDAGITYIHIILVICSAAGLFALTVEVAKGFRSSAEKISIFGLRFQNPVYDPYFEDVGLEEIKTIQQENIKLKEDNQKLESFTDSLLDELEVKDVELENVQYVSETFIRHHKNSSRLIRSLTSLLDENSSGWTTEFYNNVLDECITVLHQDRSDKSSTLYIIEDDVLKMTAYHRVNFSSTRSREFEYGEGFAGNVWKNGEVELVSDICASTYFKGDFSPNHNYGSIIGLPVKINHTVVGVLCIQSEGIDGFIEEDINTLKFYADVCALAYYYDNINVTSDMG